MAKKFDPKAKAKREKVIAAVAGVVLLGVLAISVPMTMKMMKSQNSASSSASSTPVTTTATTPAAPAATPSAPTAADLVSATVTPTAGLSQLGSLDRFEAKDPFEQQIAPGGAGLPTAAPAPAGPRASRAGGSSGGASLGPSAGDASASNRSSPSVGAPAVPPPTSAVISVNGGPAQQIALDQDFPLPPFDPIFHLVSLTRNAVKVAIVGGSYASGAPTATLRKGRPLTLMNTADGTRYVLRLLWLGSGAPPKGLLPPPAQPNSPTATTPGTPTPPTAPTATSTTP